MPLVPVTVSRITAATASIRNSMISQCRSRE